MLVFEFQKIPCILNTTTDVHDINSSIVHDISSSFDCDPTVNVRGVFLDISKAFNKVWHDGILFKLKIYGVKGKLLILIKNSMHVIVKSGVPQGLYSVHLCF